MAYTLNFNSPPNHAGDTVDLDDATATRLERLGYITTSLEVEVTDESDSDDEDNEESNTDFEDTNERIDE